MMRPDSDVPAASTTERAGKNAPKGKSMGHAGAIVAADGTGSAENKEKALRAAGVHIAETTTGIVDILKTLEL